MIVRRGAGRKHFDHNDRVRDFHRFEVGWRRADDERVGLERVAGGKTDRHAVRKNAALAGPRVDNAFLRAQFCAENLVSACAARSGDIMTGWPSRSSQRPSRPSPQTRKASTSISSFAGLDMPDPSMAGNG